VLTSEIWFRSCSPAPHEKRCSIRASWLTHGRAEPVQGRVL
jgi:hypothetical protein